MKSDLWWTKVLRKRCILAICVTRSFVDPVAAIHQAIRGCQIKRDNMGKTYSTHGDTKGSAIQEIECLPVFPELKVGRFFLP